MKLFVTGATGFTGSRTVPLLLTGGMELRCLYRPGSDRSVLPQPGIEWVLGDVSDREKLASLMEGSQVLLNLASLGFGHAHAILAAAREANVQRAVFISTTAIFTRLNARSKAIRLAAEAAIEKSGLEYTILRPTMIYGNGRDRNISRLVRWLRYLPLIPVFGDGEHLQQPVHVDDVAGAIAGCLSSARSIRKSYNIPGERPLTYNQVIDTIAAQLNKRVWKVHLPFGPIAAVLQFLERIHLPFPIKSEQVLRLNEDKDFTYVEAQRDFDYRPRSFADGIRLELTSMGVR
jgi:nucleoside-diphosphate-sugar epimerase